VPLSPLNIERIKRLIALGLALLLGKVFVVDQAQAWWRQHWILKDGQQGMAVVTQVLSHDSITYRYVVSLKDFTGRDFRSWQDPRYAHVGIGEHTVIYFSTSHPWLSLINRPRGDVPEGLPLLILVWFIAARLFIAAIKPKSKWAFGPYTSPDRHKL
jgi:hypothetical protein